MGGFCHTTTITQNEKATPTANTPALHATLKPQRDAQTTPMHI
jgi:hypothetical protein